MLIVNELARGKPDTIAKVNCRTVYNECISFLAHITEHIVSLVKSCLGAAGEDCGLCDSGSLKIQIEILQIVRKIERYIENKDKILP